MNLEELARQVGFDLEHPAAWGEIGEEASGRPVWIGASSVPPAAPNFRHVALHTLSEAKFARFAALVLEEAAKTAEERPLQSGMDEWDSTAAAIRALKPVEVPATSQWRPIDTAPKDGKTEVWVYCPDAAYTKCDVARWDGDGRGGYGWVSARCVDGLAVDGTPTLWQPLPALPVAT